MAGCVESRLIPRRESPMSYLRLQLQHAARQTCPWEIAATQVGPNLAKGDFSAKHSRSEAKIGQESARHADQNAQNAALGGRKVRTMGRLRTFGHTGGVNSSKSAAESRQNA